MSDPVQGRLQDSLQDPVDAERPDIVVLALARNCAATLPAFLRFLSSLRDAGLDCRALVGENDSRDGTGALLWAAQARGELSHVPTAFMSDIRGRLARMARGREHLKRVLDGQGPAPAYVCVADIDNVMARPPEAGAVLAALAKLERPGLFAVSAASQPHYYDLLAYEDEAVSYEYLLDDIARHRRGALGYYRFFSDTIYPAQSALTRERETTCLSAFNGLTLYRGADYRLGSYLDDDYARCEHLTLNRRIAAATGRRMLVDPGLVLRTPGDHAQRGFLSFYASRVRKMAVARLRG